MIPTEPGWYWYKGDDGDEAWACVQVVAGGDPSCVGPYVGFVGEQYAYLIEHLDGTWGPKIEEPKE